MFNEDVNYKSVAYSINKSFIDEKKSKFYLYWNDKINNIDLSNLSTVDKVFVLMCQNQKIGDVTWELVQNYNINLEEDDVYDILTNYQCSDIEITAMAKSFLWYQFNGIQGLEEQIYYIMKHKTINLPYKYELHDQ